MATETTPDESDDGFEIDVQEILLQVLDSYRYMDIPISRYLYFYLIPAILGSVVLAAALVVAPFGATVKLPIILLAVLMPAGAILYPKLVQDRKKREIRERFHLFLTHLTILSTTNIDRIEIFRRLANEEEYAALAEEMGHLVGLIDTWNQSLEDGCRMRANNTPSPLLADFYERLAYSVGAGQEINEFLINEQDAIIQQYVIRYESDLGKLDVMKELYLSMMLSATFSLVFAIVLPILTGMNPITPVLGVIALFAIVQVGFLFGINTVSPYDPVWYHSEMVTDRETRIRVSVVLGMGLAVIVMIVVGVILIGLTPINPGILPLPVFLAIPTTPLMIPGLVMRNAEESVKERDEEFTSFIRALGAVESVKQTSTANVLQTLRSKDFGSLTKNIDNLYKRLHMQVDAQRSWRLFAVETGSYLIQKFGNMYVSGRRLGGDPRQLGQLISANMNEVLKLREQRGQEASTLVGVMYGITAASVFSFFVGLQVVKILINITSHMNMNNAVTSGIIFTGSYNIQHIRFLLLCLVLLNAVLSSLMIRLTDRGHFLNSYVHFVLLTWLGAIIAVVTHHVSGGLIHVH